MGTGEKGISDQVKLAATHVQLRATGCKAGFGSERIDSKVSLKLRREGPRERPRPSTYTNQHKES
jgi:hypothetical protein